MRKFVIGTLFATAIGLGALNRGAAALPSDPCSLIPKAQVASIIGPISSLRPTPMRHRGEAMAMQCRYSAGPRMAVVAVSVYSNAAEARYAVAALKRQGSAAIRGNTAVGAVVATVATHHSEAALADKLLAAALAHL